MFLNLTDDILSVPDSYWSWLRQTWMARRFLSNLKRYQKYVSGRTPVPTFRFDRKFKDEYFFWEREMRNHLVRTFVSLPRGSYGHALRELCRSDGETIGESDEKLGHLAALIADSATRVPDFEVPLDLMPNRSGPGYCMGTSDANHDLFYKVSNQVDAHVSEVGGYDFGLLVASRDLSMPGSELKRLAVAMSRLRKANDGWMGYTDKEKFGYRMPKSNFTKHPKVTVVDSSTRWPTLELGPRTTGWIAVRCPTIKNPMKLNIGPCPHCQRDMFGNEVDGRPSHPGNRLFLVSYGFTGSPPVGCCWMILNYPSRVS